MSSAYLDFHLLSLSELTLHLRTTTFLWICHVYWYIDCINKFEKKSVKIWSTIFLIEFPMLTLKTLLKSISLSSVLSFPGLERYKKF